MAKSKKKPIANEPKGTLKPLTPPSRASLSEESEFDFGGFPKDVPLKKNIGCGG